MDQKTIAWHESLELHELTAFNSIGLMKLKMGINPIQDHSLKRRNIGHLLFYNAHKTFLRLITTFPVPDFQLLLKNLQPYGIQSKCTICHTYMNLSRLKSRVSINLGLIGLDDIHLEHHGIADECSCIH